MKGTVSNLSLTVRHSQTIKSTWEGLSGKPWSLDSPVFLFDRCWLRLEKIQLSQLSKRLPTDNSCEAPELIKYKQLLEERSDNLLAVQECWAEFGIEDFHRAIRNYWYWQDKGNHGWTFNVYSNLISQYKLSFKETTILIPLIILGRRNSPEKHVVAWLGKAEVQRLN